MTDPKDGLAATACRFRGALERWPEEEKLKGKDSDLASKARVPVSLDELRARRKLVNAQVVSTNPSPSAPAPALPIPYF